jgi:acetyl coenzyme A synthetase (ADP forming)-like protein
LKDASTVVLRDGTTVDVRAAGPADQTALAEFLAALSQESRTFRFFSPIADVKEVARQLLRNKDERFALAGIAEGGKFVAHAMYIPSAAGRAEMAVAVADAYQGRGLGTIMLGQLAEAAHAAGIDTFEAVVMAANHRMLEVLRESGFPMRTRWEPGEVVAEFPTDLSLQTLERFADRERQAAAAGVGHLLAPRSVAVIGASRSPRHVGAQILGNLKRAGYLGAIYPVNPAARRVQGLKAYATVLDIPESVDLAVVAVPAAAVVETARQCGAKGVKGLVVVSAGFAESGLEGRARQEELLAVCYQAGVRLIGPNCVGVFNTAPEVRLNVTFAPQTPKPGRVAFMSQSGGLGLALMSHAARLGLGLSSFVSVGNKADISGNDLLQFWETDSGTDVILLYLESFGNPRKFARIARRVARQKPIIAVKSGRSPAGSRATASHTGALLGASDVTVDALFQQAGVIRTDTLAELFDLASLLARQPVPTGKRVAILTNAGGPGILCADACHAAALDVIQLPETARSELARFVSPASSTVNPVDLLAEATAEDFGRAVLTLNRCPEVDAIVVILTPTMTTGTREVATAIAKAANEATRQIPVLAVFLGSGEVPKDLPFPSYAFPEEAALALSHAARYGAWRSAPEPEPEILEGIDSMAAASVIAAGLAAGGGWMAPADLGPLLACYGIPLAPARFAATAVEAGEAAVALGGAVALKAVAPNLVHKTEAGGVRLGLKGRRAVSLAADKMAARLAAGGHDASGFVVQQMAPAGVEMLVGVVHDPSFGPVLACAAGGTAAELLHDLSVRITPVNRDDVRSMVRSLKTYPLLDGYRGRPRADVSALEEVLLRVGAMVEAHPDMAELDLNPVIVHARGAVVVDARLRLQVAPPIKPLGAR